MKKITLALALLLAVGLLAATAQELTATVSGSATATIGFDLDAKAFGIVNSATSDVSLTLASGTATTEATDGWYGYVSLASFKLALDYAGGADYLTAVAVAADGTDTDELVDVTGTVADSGLIVTAPTVTAKITNGTTYVQIWALDGFVTGYADEVENDKSDISIEGADTDIGVDLSNGTGGFTFGTVAGPATIAAHFATLTGYDGANSDDNAKFLVGADVGVTAGPATVNLELVRGIGTDETLGLGLKTALTAGPAKVGVAFDSKLPDGGDFAFEVRGDIDLTFGAYGAFIDAFYATDNVDIEIGSSPAFGPIALAVLFGLYDVTTDLGWGVDLGATYTVNDMVKVVLDFAYDSAGVIPIALTATITNPIPHVTMTAKWATADIAADANNLGDVTFATKISY
jgi:hypothetical protein